MFNVGELTSVGIILLLLVTGCNASSTPIVSERTMMPPVITPTKLIAISEPASPIVTFVSNLPTPTNTPVSSPIPTITPIPTEAEALLSNQVGFTDERIAVLERLRSELESTRELTVDEEKYKEFIIKDISGRVLLIYRVGDNQPILLLDSRSEKVPGLGKLIGGVFNVKVEDWGDLNHDGRPDLIVYYSEEAGSWSVNRQVHLLQITDSGEVVYLSRPIYEDYGLIPQYRRFEDINNDGVLEFFVGDYRGEWYGKAHADGVSSFKVYAWEGAIVRDISAEMPELYKENISHQVKTIEDSYGSVLDEYTANKVIVAGFGLLMDYENSGRRDEGWKLYWQLTDLSNWTDLSPEAERIIVEKRTTHREQYQSGKPFG